MSVRPNVRRPNVYRPNVRPRCRNWMPCSDMPCDWWIVMSNSSLHTSRHSNTEHRRDVSALVVFHKAQVLEILHLGLLRFTPCPAKRCTRAALTSDELVEVPRSHSRQHQRTFTARTARLSNRFTAATSDVPNISTPRVNLSAYRWRGTRLADSVVYINNAFL